MAEKLLECIGNTPLVKLSKLGSSENADIYIKLEYLNPTGSYKDRMADAIIHGAENRGDLRSGMTVIECTAGSTGTSLAFVCALKGYPLKIITSDAFAPEKLRAMKVFGAVLEIVSAPGGKITPDLIPQMMKKVQDLSLSQQYYWTRQFENIDALSGYEVMGAEITKQFSGRVDAFCASVGTAGMYVGMTKILREANENILTFIVEPSSSPLIAKGIKGTHSIDGISVGFVPPLLSNSTYNEVLLIEESEARLIAKRLAKEEGIFAGTSTGLNVAAALRLAKKLGKGKNVLTVACDSGMKYINTGLFD
ncbi:PLP-dependent cysteine synthase family protein [Flavitalea sp.]|nr:cysteine synthase family protein [Flavitalea sp.]